MELLDSASLLRFEDNPAEPCGREDRNPAMQGGVLSSALLLPTSFDYRDKSIDMPKGGLQTTVERRTPLIQTVGPFTRPITH